MHLFLFLNNFFCFILDMMPISCCNHMPCEPFWKTFSEKIRAKQAKIVLPLFIHICICLEHISQVSIAVLHPIQEIFLKVSVKHNCKWSVFSLSGVIQWVFSSFQFGEILLYIIWTQVF